MTSTKRCLAILLAIATLQNVSAGLSPPAVLLRSSASTLSSVSGSTLTAKANPKKRGKAQSEPESQFSLVLDKFSTAASAAKQEAEKLSADARLKLKSAVSNIEGTIKKHPRESATAAVVALALVFLLGDSEPKIKAKDSSLFDYIFSAGNKTTHALASVTSKALGGPAAVISDCLAATPGLLNQTFWAVENGFVEVAHAITDICVAMSGVCTEGACRFGNAVSSWGEDFVSNTTFRVKNVGNAVTSLVTPSALSYTQKAGSLGSGTFTLDLGKTMVVGAVIVENKKCKTRGKKKDLVLAGTKEFEIYTSEDGKEWKKAHHGSLTAGAPKAKSQYVTFKGQWARYVKFVSLSSYQGGSGLEKIYLHSPIGLNTIHWLLRFKDTVHSFYEAHAPEYWDEIEMPPIKDAQSGIVFLPLLVSKYLGLQLPDDLWIGNVTRTVQHVSKGCVNATKGVGKACMAVVDTTATAITSAACAVSDATNKIGLTDVSNKIVNGTAAALKALNIPFSSNKVAPKDTSNECLPLPVLGLLGLGAYYYREPIEKAVGPYAEQLLQQADKMKGQVGTALNDVKSQIQTMSASVVDSVQKCGKGSDKVKGNGGQKKQNGPRRFGKA